MLRQLRLTMDISGWIFLPWRRSISNIKDSPPPPPLASTFDDVIVDYEDPDYLPLPEYPVRPNEPLETRKQRLLYQSRKRGMLENDLLLSTFAAKHLQNFSAEQTAQYDQLINGVSNDWDIYYWATDVKPTPKEYDTEIMGLLKEHVKNAERVTRLRQPDLNT
ncbi:succinate dehydrogenase assembly factor 2-A, mitochondrial isoform X1 [Drosophila teissieri]|uniref:succinate dehydrogenase assembly factor 2-A, mitochondrial n=2 Tax=melanogaster subgroup TaxID=32351 RepID=UPI0019544BB9|nr:succinate dehydrogenase assembly factor 2-A, mitochondrial [Drosophila santomea]XP_043640745.1 succinate dehydrogenase assembly factor 2-A, mitochondrial isoform X1 [Drosophila teissieri]